MSEREYPTEQELERIRKWGYEDGFEALGQFICDIWHWDNLTEFRDWKKDEFKISYRELRLATGGWSGRGNAVWRGGMCGKTSWKRKELAIVDMPENEIICGDTFSESVDCVVFPYYAIIWEWRRINLVDLSKEHIGDQNNLSGVGNGYLRSTQQKSVPRMILQNSVRLQKPQFFSGYGNSVLKDVLFPKQENLSIGDFLENKMECMEKQEKKIPDGMEAIHQNDNLFMPVRPGKSWLKKLLKEMAIAVKNVVQDVLAKYGWSFITKSRGLNIQSLDLRQAI